MSPSRFRVPEVSVIVNQGPPEQILRTPPLICIEIVSKDDRLSEMQKRIDDSPWRCTSGGTQETAELHTEGPDTLVPVAPLFD